MVTRPTHWRRQFLIGFGFGLWGRIGFFFTAAFFFFFPAFFAICNLLGKELEQNTSL